MIINSLKLIDYRNYSGAKIELSPETNVIIGNNAQGKTNLLEAVYYTAAAKSFRSADKNALIKEGADFAVIESDFHARKRNFSFEAVITRASRRLLINGVKPSSISELPFRCVLFCPDDLYIIKKDASARRHFMDSVLSQLRPRYSANLSEYNKLIDHKTQILKNKRQDMLDTLEEFNIRLAQTGAQIIYYRALFIVKLKAVTSKIHSDISGSNESLSLSYKTVSNIEDPIKQKDELFEKLREHQNSHLRAELETGRCLSGPHKDDIIVMINGREAKTYGSQGQIRTAALSMKMAEGEIIKADAGEPPVLLLDDVLSELDAARRDYILNNLSGGQVLITCCSQIDMCGGQVFYIENGKVNNISR